jgi:hypothetical protein
MLAVVDVEELEVADKLPETSESTVAAQKAADALMFGNESKRTNGRPGTVMTEENVRATWRA